MVLGEEGKDHENVSIEYATYFDFFVIYFLMESHSILSGLSLQK